MRAAGVSPCPHFCCGLLRTQLTVLGGLTLAGVVACLTVDAPTDRDVFLAFVRHELVPALRPGQLVVLDNLSPHKATAVRALIAAAGCTLVFLPQYSPDFNPIELCWSKLKTLLRGAAARTRDTLERALAAALDAVTTADARGWFAHCGYAAQN